MVEDSRSCPWGFLLVVCAKKNALGGGSGSSAPVSVRAMCRLPHNS